MSFLKKIKSAGAIEDNTIEDNTSNPVKTTREQEASPKLHQHADWIDPATFQEMHHLTRDDPEALRLLEQEGKSGDEPYKGPSLHDVAWRVSPRHVAENGKRLIPIKVNDLRGTLGKDVPLGGHDPLIFPDRQFKVTQKLLERHADKPLTIQTRSDLIAAPEYLPLLNPKMHRVKIHILSTDPNALRLAEPDVPSAERRVKAALALADAGVPVTIVIDRLSHPRMPPDVSKMLQVDRAVLHGQLQGRQIKTEVNEVKLTDKALQRLLSILGTEPLTAMTRDDIFKALQTRYPKQSLEILGKVTADVLYSGEPESVLAAKPVLDRLFERWAERKEAKVESQRMNADSPNFCPICKLATTPVMLDKDRPAVWCARHMVIFPKKNQEEKQKEVESAAVTAKYQVVER